MPVPGHPKHVVGEESPVGMILLIFPGKSYGSGGAEKKKENPLAGTSTKI